MLFMRNILMMKQCLTESWIIKKDLIDFRLAEYQ